MAYVKIPETLIYNNAALRNSAAMRAWLYLYTSSTSATTWANKAYPVGQRVSSRSFVADALEVGDGVVKNVFKALSKWGLVDFVVEPTIKTNVATVAAVTMQHGYIYAQLPANYDYFIENEHHWQVYLYLMLHAAKERCKLLGNRILERGQALLTQGSIAKALRISLTELKQIFDDLRDLDLIKTKRVGNDGLMTTMTLYPSKIDGSVTDEEIAAAKKHFAKPTVNTSSETPTPSANTTETDNNLTIEEPHVDDELEDAVRSYVDMREFSNPKHINNIVLNTADALRKIPDMDSDFVRKCLGYLFKTKGNNILDDKGKPVYVDHIYLSNYVINMWKEYKYQHKFKKFKAEVRTINSKIADILDNNCRYFGFPDNNNTFVLLVDGNNTIEVIESNIKDIKASWFNQMGKLRLNYKIAAPGEFTSQS